MGEHQVTRGAGGCFARGLVRDPLVDDERRRVGVWKQFDRGLACQARLFDEATFRFCAKTLDQISGNGTGSRVKLRQRCPRSAFR
jgi:hypothetical protein